MKRTLFTLTCLAIALHVQAQREVSLQFNLRNVRATDTLTLSWGASNKSMAPLITSFIPTETTEISVPLNEPRVMILGIKGQTGGLELLLSPNDQVSISGRLRNNTRYLLDRLKVKGATHQDTYTYEVHNYYNIIDSLEEDTRSQFKDITRLIAECKERNDEECIARTYQTPRGQEYIEYVMNNFNERKELFEQIIYKHKNTFMGPLLMIRFMGRLSKAYREMYNVLSDEAKLSYYGREVKDEVYPPSLVGDIAPTVTVINTDGSDKVLSFTRHGNRYLLLDFWASWCEPCHKEIPNLKMLYDKYHSKGLDIIGISADHNVADWKSTLEEQQEPWCNYLDKNRQAISEYKVQYIPSIFIIDKEGNIIAEKLRGKELADYIDNLFKESTK